VFELMVEQGTQRVDKRPRLRLPCRTALLGRTVTDLGLDCVQSGDARDFIISHEFEQVTLNSWPDGASSVVLARINYLLVRLIATLSSNSEE
jgi:hypothetical protein